MHPVREQDLLDLVPDFGRVLLARHVNDARIEAPERIPAEEKLDPSSILEIENAGGRAHQFSDRALEKLVAWIGIENVDQRLAAVP